MKSQLASAAFHTSYFKDENSIFHILSSITEGFFFVDQEWKILCWNKSAERISHYCAQEVLGKPLWNVFPAHLNCVFDAHLRKVKETNQTIEFESHDTGTDLWLEAKAYPSAEGIAVYFKDITTRKRLSLLMTLQKEQYEALINASSDSIWSVDQNFRLLAANHSFKRYAQYYSGKKIEAGECVLDLMSEAEGLKWKPYYERGLRESFTYDLPIVYESTGESIYTEVTCNPIKNEVTAEVMGVACIARDITSSKRYIKLIEEKNRKLSAQNEMLQKVAYLQSHEVRRPLANILGLIELLKEAQSEDEKSQLVEMLNLSSLQLDNIIREIVNASQMSASNGD